jgi:hypothetical protein
VMTVDRVLGFRVKARQETTRQISAITMLLSRVLQDT